MCNKACACAVLIQLLTTNLEGYLSLLLTGGVVQEYHCAKANSICAIKKSTKITFLVKMVVVKKMQNVGCCPKD